jgi:pimeloyl-ACP methyl ester carboxylesterase
MTKHNIRNLNVSEFGEQNKPAIVFIHAFPFCNRMWDKQVETLQQSFRVITPDLRALVTASRAMVYLP